MVEATPPNKAAAISWVKSFNPAGCTCIYDGFEKAAAIPETEVIILHTDGVQNTGKYPTPEQCGPAIVNLAKSKGIKVYTFGHCLSSYYPPSLHERGRRMLQLIAKQTGGTFTEVN